jgi:hypothetical protein
MSYAENMNSWCVYSFRGEIGADYTELFRKVDKTRKQWLSEICT